MTNIHLLEITDRNDHMANLCTDKNSVKVDATPARVVIQARIQVPFECAANNLTVFV